MSSFKEPNKIYFFVLSNGKKKIAYGRNPLHALETLKYRLSPEEVSQIIQSTATPINPKDITKIIKDLG